MESKPKYGKYGKALGNDRIQNSHHTITRKSNGMCVATHALYLHWLYLHLLGIKSCKTRKDVIKHISLK